MVGKCVHCRRNIRPVTSNRGLEDDALVVAFAVALGLDAVAANGSLLAAFDAPFATC